MTGDQDHGYAPQSPDLSAYHSPEPPYQSSTSYPQYHAYSDPQPPLTNNGSFHSHLAQYQFQSSGDFSSGNMPRRNRSQMELEEEWAPTPATQGRGRKTKKQKVEEHFDRPTPGVEQGIEVKTKFPVARIKRIMQADEDVGKVAQVTPTAVSKALELFMISLVTKAAEQARSKSAKKVTAAHLKQVVGSDEQFDFLSDVISKVPDAPAPKKDEDSEGAVEGKKKRGPGRRKAKDSDDF